MLPYACLTEYNKRAAKPPPFDSIRRNVYPGGRPPMPKYEDRDECACRSVGEASCLGFGV